MDEGQQPVVLDSRRGLRIKIIVLAVLLLFVNLVVLAVLPDASGVSEEAIIGYVLGSIYAHAFLAAAWCNFGPGRPIVRWTISPVWVAGALLVVVIHFERHGVSSSELWTIGGLLYCQWFVSILIMGTVAIFSGVRLRSMQSNAIPTTSQQSFRFNIRDLLIIISVSAVLLAIGRTTLQNFVIPAGNSDFIIFAYLSIAAILITLPLGLSMLMGGRSLLALPLALIWLVAATVMEVSLFSDSGLSGPNKWHLIAINGFSTVVVLLIVGLLSWAGYRLRIVGRRSVSKSPES